MELIHAFPFLPSHETERLVLREMRLDTRMQLVLKSPPALVKAFLAIQSDAEWEQQQLKAKLGKDSWNTPICWFQLFDKQSGESIGSCGFHSWNVMHRRAEIGYALSDDRWKRKGFMTEALDFVLDFGFQRLNLHRVEACIGPWNEASIALIQKFGFSYEGKMREHYFKNDIHEDSLLYALLQKEYHV